MTRPVKRARDPAKRLTLAQRAAIVKDPAVRKAIARVLLWSGATGGDRSDPRVVKANDALNLALSIAVSRSLRSDSRGKRGG